MSIFLTTRVDGVLEVTAIFAFISTTIPYSLLLQHLDTTLCAGVELPVQAERSDSPGESGGLPAADHEDRGQREAGGHRGGGWKHLHTAARGRGGGQEGGQPVLRKPWSTTASWTATCLRGGSKWDGGGFQSDLL